MNADMPHQMCIRDSSSARCPNYKHKFAFVNANVDIFQCLYSRFIGLVDPSEFNQGNTSHCPYANSCLTASKAAADSPFLLCHKTQMRGNAK